MPSVRSAILRAQIRLVRPLMKRMDIEDERRAQSALGELGARAMKEKIEYHEEIFANFDAEWARPTSVYIEHGAVLYLHGGSYTAGDLAYAKGFGGILADAINRETLCVDYRLAPEYPFPAALDDAEAAYMRVLERHPPNLISFVGESAGGGLCFALALRLKQKGLPLPGCIVAMSPWTDLRCVNDAFVRVAHKDPCLFQESLAYSARLYSGGDTTNPLVSPIFGDLSGLPPCLIYAGTDEILLDDSLLMAKRLRDAGVRFELNVVEGMWHAFCLYGVPEAKEAIAHIDEFIDINC